MNIDKALIASFESHADSDEPTDYNARNNELFGQRNRVKRELGEVVEELAKLSDDNAAQRRALLKRKRRLERELDTVTGTIVAANYRLLKKLTGKFTKTTNAETTEEYRAAALLGLMIAIESYDPEKGRFSTWAYNPISRCLILAVRDTEHQNLNRTDFEQRPKVMAAMRALKTPDYTPSWEEVAALAGPTVTPEQARRVLTPYRLEPMHAKVGPDGDTEMGEMLESPEPAIEQAVLSSMFLKSLEANGLKVLSDRELYVISRRYGLDGHPSQKLAEIGEELNLSREAVRQIEAKAVSKLLHPVVFAKVLRDSGRATVGSAA